MGGVVAASKPPSKYSYRVAVMHEWNDDSDCQALEMEGYTFMGVTAVKNDIGNILTVVLFRKVDNGL